MNETDIRIAMGMQARYKGPCMHAFLHRVFEWICVF